jgi:putative transcriptional regulator
MIIHHPDDELLFDYATGALTEALALAIASHASLCRHCAGRIAQYETLGGAMIEDDAAADINEGSFAALLKRLDEPAPAEKAAAALDRATERLLPRPLRQYLDRGLDALPWKRVGGLYQEYRLPLARRDIKASLMRIDPGAHMPRHSHRGQEYTLVLAGGYRDGDDAFVRGDFDAKSPSDQHQPVVDPDEPCLCLVILDAPVKLSGAVGFFVNPFLRI